MFVNRARHRIAIVAGEPSGDLLASCLMRSLHALCPEIEFYGIGGPLMLAEGLVQFESSDRLAVNGYVDVIKRYIEISSIRRRFIQTVLAKGADLFIGVDAPDFNLSLAETLRKSGMKTCHFVSPSLWAWRGGRIHKIKRAVDQILVLFPFEVDIYTRAGIAVTYVGHPLADQIAWYSDKHQARSSLGLKAAGSCVALLPGSRDGELRHLTSLMLETARQLFSNDQGVCFVTPFVSEHALQTFSKALDDEALVQGRQRLPVTLVLNASHQAMAAADVVVLASGTATLECALVKRPMVIVYRGAWLNELILPHLLYLPWVGLPNILCQELIVPELLGKAATAQQVVEYVQRYLSDPSLCEQIRVRFEALHHELKHDASARAAQAVMALLD